MRALRGAVLLLGLCAAAGSAVQQQQPSGPPGQPPGAYGTCEGACQHYLECKGMAQDGQAHAQCVGACGQAGIDTSSLSAYEGLDCGSAVAMVEQQGQLGGGGLDSEGGGYIGGGGGEPGNEDQPLPPPSGQSPPASDECPPIDRRIADPRFLALFTQSAWCGNGRLRFSPDGTVEENGERGCWRLVGNRLAFSGDGRSWQETPARFDTDAGGQPTVLLGGDDRYQRCQ